MFKMKTLQIFSRRERRSAFLNPNRVTGIEPLLQRRTANLFFLLLLGLALAPAGLPGQGRCLVYLTGPSFSRHFSPYHDRLNELHLGLGVEAYYRKKHLLLGGSGHFMFNDSNNRTSYWIGMAPGYFVGVQKKFWAALAAVVGGLKKHEYNNGRFSFFALPYLTIGCNRIGLNIGYIPRISSVTCPILLVQLKVLVYPFRGL